MPLFGSTRASLALAISICLVLVLNTLDLLKKGTTPLAIHARAASRFLEAQVGTNPRIHVQRDEDFCAWDDIYADASATATASSSTTPNEDDTLPPEDRAPEWMRQTICCTIWEIRLQPSASRPDASTNSTLTRPQPRKVALAVVKPLSNAVEASMSNNPAAEGSAGGSSTIMRYADRATGELIRIWAPLLGVKVLHIEQGAAEHPSSASRIDGPKPTRRGRDADGGVGGHRKSRSSEDGTMRQSAPRGLVEKVKNGVDAKSVVVAPGSSSPVLAAPGVNKIRLLSRGEKLEP